MSEEMNVVTCTWEDLKRFARGEILYDALLGVQQDAIEWETSLLQCENPYQITFEDVKEAIRQMIVKKRDAYDIFANWYLPMVDRVGDLLGLASLLGYPNEIFEDVRWELEKQSFPQTKEELCRNIFYDLECDESSYTAYVLDDEEIPSLMKEYLECMENFSHNQNRPITEWKFTKRQKEEFVFEHEEEEDLQGLSKEKQYIFKQFLDELCEEGNLNAIRIKGYACYGGNIIYPCDWYVSRDCMLVLVEQGTDEIQAMAANTLGYIYYYGRCNHGIPEYDLAFKYFSLASFFGYFEATYKVGDMLVDGKGIPKNKTVAYRLYEQVYTNCYERFQSGDHRHTLADAALRMGSAYLNGYGVCAEPMKAYYYYLQAKLAIDIRMKHSDFFGNKKVLAGIEKGLKESKAMLQEVGVDVKQTEAIVDMDEILEQLMFSCYVRRTFDLQIKNSEDKIYLTFQRGSLEDEEDGYDLANKVMLTVPEVSFCECTDTVTVQCAKDACIHIEGGVSDLKFNRVVLAEEYIKLYWNGKRKVMIRAREVKFVVGDQQ